jgi:glycosyltransferase involved in cell wall biosynthesis
MHILYIYSEITILGGTDKVLIQKANYLANHGYQVTVVTEAQMGRPLSFPLDRAVRHIDMGLDFNKQYKRGTLGRACVYYFLMHQYKKRLKEILYKERPDITISIMGRSIDIISSIHDGSVKIVEAHTTKHFLRSYHLMEQRGGLFKYIARYLRSKMCSHVAKLDGIVLLTQQDANDWKEAKRAFVIPNAVPYFPKERASLDNKQVIMVGRYNDAKGYDYLISAWEKVHERHPDWVLNAYGSGELHDQVVGWIAEHHLEASFILHEPTNHITEKYLESSICVLSSRYEGFSLVILEAMACGVPFVSFDCPHGPRNIIRNGEDGLLVEYLNVQALADGICQLIENVALRKRLGECAKKNVQRFTEINVMQQWEKLFRELRE